MYLVRLFLLCLMFCCFNGENISFKNITIHGYSVYTHKFKVNITSSNNLKSELPRAVFDAIEIKGQNVPILYENCIANIDSLDELILEENGIQEIQVGALKNLEQLRIIKLKNNKLTTIKSGVFNHLPISDIDLTKNDISVIEEKAFDNMAHLLNVRMSDNKITKWNKNWFSNTPSLTRVSFQHNLIEELPADAFKNMVGVKMLGRIPLTLSLIFSYNKIKKLHPQTFNGLEKVNNLWLDNNLIEEIPDKLLVGLSIEDLRLSGNKLTCIEDKNSVLKAERNDIDANPFECECLGVIKKWAREENRTVSLFYADMNCYADRLNVKMKSLQDTLNKMKTKTPIKDEAEVV